MGKEKTLNMHSSWLVLEQIHKIHFCSCKHNFNVIIIILLEYDSFLVTIASKLPLVLLISYVAKVKILTLSSMK